MKLLSVCMLLVLPLGAGADDRTAVAYLAEVMDRYHRTFDVYTDRDAAGNHFAVRARMHSDDAFPPAMDEGWSEHPYSGATCIRASFRAHPTKPNWGAWYFMNGVAPGVPNWGTHPDAGIDLRGATRLTFFARGERGGEEVEFFAFGVGWNPDTGEKSGKADSSPKLMRRVTLSHDWRSYTLDVRGRDLSYVLGGFGWGASAAANGMRDVTFYLDDIRYELDDRSRQARLSEPRFLVSYETHGRTTFDRVMRNAAHTYDNALVLLAFLAAGETDRARRIADAFVVAQACDRQTSPLYRGTLRNSYQGGDLLGGPEWPRNVRIHGWYEPGAEWKEDAYSVSLDAGNMAWAMLALLAFHEITVPHGDSAYLRAAVRLGEWIDRECGSSDGYTGGYNGWEPDPVKAPYRATEHNIDLYAAFERLHRITGDEHWRKRAERALRFIQAMWNEREGMFWTGTEDGTNTTVIPLDIQAWAVLAIPNETLFSKSDRRRALQYVERHMGTAETGYDYSRKACIDEGTKCRDAEGVWYEGTAQMAAAYAHVGNMTKEKTILAFLARSQDCGALPASNRDEGLETGFIRQNEPIRYFRRRHIGATAWYVLAAHGVNPYWMPQQ